MCKDKRFLFSGKHIQISCPKNFSIKGKNIDLYIYFHNEWLCFLLLNIDITRDNDGTLMYTIFTPHP